MVLKARGLLSGLLFFTNLREKLVEEFQGRLSTKQLQHPGLRLGIKIMKLTAIILLSACLTASAKGSSQNISLNVKDASLEKVFEEIKRQSGYSFVYTKDLIEKADKVTLKANKKPIEEVLESIFADQPFTYTIISTVVVVNTKDILSTKESEEKGEAFIDISGRITDEDGNGLSGASIRVKGRNDGITTDGNGFFKLSGVEENQILEISFVGFETKAISIAAFKGLNNIVSLKRKDNPLDVIRVEAYRTITKRFSTSNTGTVTAAEIEKQPVTNPILAIQGRIPGLTVTQATGIPGSAATIRVQGRNNLHTNFTGSDPLIVVDGVPFPSQNLLTFQTGIGTSTVLGPREGAFNSAGSTLALINPDDIESIDVLKDADATAIYGSRAANGAILITTKRGKTGETRVDISLQYGLGKVGHKLDLLNTQQYLEMRHEAKMNDGAGILATDYDLNGFWDSTRFTDWQKVLIGGTAKFTRVNATLSGGSLLTKYLIGSTFSKETSVFPGDFENSKGSVHFNIHSSTSNNKFYFQLGGSYLLDNNNMPGIDFTRFIGLSPVAPALYNPDGTLNWAPLANGNSSWDNPLSYNYNLFENKSTNLISNAIVGYRIVPGLELKSSFGYSQVQTNQFLASLDGSQRPERRSTRTRSATFVDNSIQSWIAEPQISYSRNINATNRLEGLVGITFQQTTSDGILTSGIGQSSDDLLKSLSAATSVSSSNSNAVYRYNGIFGRFNYIFKSRYLVNLSARRDGSSRFGSENLFHNFGALGIGWIFSEERFIKSGIPFLSYGKLRCSYGLTGNDQIGDYGFMSLFRSTRNSIPYQTIRGLEPLRISNPYLQWEENRKLQSGIDLGFRNDRYLLSINYFRNRSNNTLNTVALPIITGTSNIVQNFHATIQNTGWEFSLKLDNARGKNLIWTSSFNLTIPRNKLMEFPDLQSSSFADLYIVGKPLNIYKTYSFYGIDPQTGGFLHRDAEGNITATPDFSKDRVVVIDLDERFYGGLANSIGYKNLQLEFLFQFSSREGFDFYNFGGVPGRFNTITILGNQPTTVLKRWQKPGDITNMPRYQSTSANPILGNWNLVDASFVRLKNISLSYDLPKKLLNRGKIKNSKIFINGQNIFTITKYKGLDPETRSISNLPPLRVITAGIKVSL